MSLLVKTLNNLGINNFTIVDVGAKGNIEDIKGIEKITEIYAFEPNPTEFAILQKNYSKHPYYKLNLSALALSDGAGKSTLNISKNNSMSSLLEPDLANYKKHFGHYKAYQTWANNIEIQKIIEISIDNIDHYFNTDQSIDYLKIDTQGSELLILKGAINKLKKGLVKVIKVEVSTVTTYQNQVHFSDIDLFLRHLNYSLIDFVTYKDSPSYLLKEDSNIHSAPCGDAIYYFTPNYDDKNENIKKSVIINTLGYSSLAVSILNSMTLNVSDKNELIRNSKKKNNQIFKSIAKDLLPPVVIKLLKIIKNKL